MSGELHIYVWKVEFPEGNKTAFFQVLRWMKIYKIQHLKKY